jgi:hypothetical protein
MLAVTAVGLDIAKSVFQVHGIDAEGKGVVRRKLKRRYVLAFFDKLPPWLVGIEACATSHYWARELQALGHRVRLMPPAYVGTSSGRKTMPPPRPSARRSPDPICGSLRSRQSSSRVAWCFIARGKSDSNCGFW